MLYINPAARISLGWDRPTIHDTFALATGLDSSNAASCDAVVLATSLDSSNAATCNAFVLATGLDSSNAARVVDILAGLAAAGVTVIITIHQPRPDVFNLMQRVMILSGDGRLVYSGAAHSFSIPSALFNSASPLHTSTQHLLCTTLLSILSAHLYSASPLHFSTQQPPLLTSTQHALCTFPLSVSAPFYSASPLHHFIQHLLCTILLSILDTFFICQSPLPPFPPLLLCVGCNMCVEVCPSQQSAANLAYQ